MKNATIESITDQSKQEEQIIMFEDEGAQEIMQSPNQTAKLDNQMLQATTREDRNHSIPDFLNRVYQIDNFTWSKTSVRGEVLKQYRFPDVLLNNANIQAKIRNFFGFRAGVELTILINKQPFQAGNLMISFLPNAKYNVAKDALHKLKEGIVSRSGSPRTNLDLMDGTKATLQVPFMSPFVYYNLLDKSGTIGDFYISVYSPLSDVAATGTVSVQVMARFIDIDLEFPTGIVPATYNPLAQAISCLTENPKYSRKGIKTAIDRLRKLIEDADSGKVVQQSNQRCVNIKQKALPNMADSDGIEHSHVLSLCKNNSLSSVAETKAGPAEMDFKHILAIPNYFNAFNIAKSQAAGTLLFSTLVSPTILPNISSDYGTVVDYFAFLAANFKKWRGSIKFSFRAIKTTFHSCRVRVWFCPGAADATNVDRNACISKIVDLKELNTFEFEVPYVWPRPWLDCSDTPNSLGVLGIDLINALVSPDTVADNFDVVMERSMGSDFSFNLPRSNNFAVFDISTVPPSTPLSHLRFDKLRHQVATQSNQDNQRTLQDDTSFERPGNSQWADERTMGSNINNVKQMISRATGFIRKSLYIPTTNPNFTLSATLGTIVLNTIDNVYSFSGTPIEVPDKTGINPDVPVGGSMLVNVVGNILVLEYDTGVEIVLHPGLYTITAETAWFRITNSYINSKLVTKTTFVTELTTDAFPKVTLTSAVETPYALSIQPHALLGAFTDANNNVVEPSYDSLSYFSSIYSFYRGSVDIRIFSTAESYIVQINPNDSGSNGGKNRASEIVAYDVGSASSLITQAVRTSVEGFGEFHIPYYAQSYCSSIVNKGVMVVKDEINNLTLPETTMTIIPNEAVESIRLFRSGGTDFEMFYLCGTPILV